jgi:hypothetical protein
MLYQPLDSSDGWAEVPLDRKKIAQSNRQFVPPFLILMLKAWLHWQGRHCFWRLRYPLCHSCSCHVPSWTPGRSCKGHWEAYRANGLCRLLWCFLCHPLKEVLHRTSETNFPDACCNCKFEPPTVITISLTHLSPFFSGLYNSFPPSRQKRSHSRKKEVTRFALLLRRRVCFQSLDRLCTWNCARLILLP